MKTNHATAFAWICLISFCVLACAKNEVAEPPKISITSFTPQSATADDRVKITGKNFTNVSKVNFGGISAQSFTVVNDSVIFAKVSSGSVSGSIGVSNANGSFELPGFIYYKPQRFTVSGLGKYASLRAFPAMDSSGYIEASFQETATIELRKINRYDSIRNTTERGAFNIQSPYIDSANYMVIAGLADDAYQFSVGVGVPSYRFSLTGDYNLFVKVVGTQITIPKQNPKYGVMITGSGVVNATSISLSYTTEYRGNSKNGSLFGQ